MYTVRGKAYKDRLTKLLVQKVHKNNIAVIHHKAIDLVAAQDLVYKRVKAVINCERTIDKRCRLDGVKYLLKCGIKLFDVYDKNFFDYISDGDLVAIDKFNRIYVNGILAVECIPVEWKDLMNTYERKGINHMRAKRSFVKNTMSYMDSELNFYLYGRNLPELNTEIAGREVVVVSRGRNYREDLKAVKNYIINRKPVIISVDGGADAVNDLGLISDIIIGDMDSVSDQSLIRCREILIHTYSSGYAPGLSRIKALKLKNFKLLKVKGTSEDAAVYTAKIKGASAIYLIGSHFCIDDFIEKGRSGMGSTALIRILMGANIIDLKGISTVMRYNYMSKARVSVILILLSVITCLLVYLSSAADYIQAYLKFLLD